MPNFVFRKFDAGFPEGRSTDELEEWLKQLAKEVVATEIPKLMNDKEELLDEQLASAYQAGFPRGKTLLLERYATKVHELAPRIISAKGICPESEDPLASAQDVAQEVSLKLVTELDNYRLESSFETWVGRI